MVFVHSFPPISDLSAEVLILGSMPGKASLQARQYYAHPRNSFWTILGEVIGIDPTAAYEVRIDGLIQNGIALWDVLKSCTRKSSLDSDIDESSIVVNEFDEFLHKHPALRHIFFNGAKAELAYQRYVLPALSLSWPIEYERLPSTSPAHAAIPYEQKLQTWRAIASVRQRRARATHRP